MFSSVQSPNWMVCRCHRSILWVWLPSALACLITSTGPHTLSISFLLNFSSIQRGSASCSALNLVPWRSLCLWRCWCKCLMTTAHGSEADPLFVTVLLAFAGNQVFSEWHCASVTSPHTLSGRLPPPQAVALHSSPSLPLSRSVFLESVASPGWFPPFSVSLPTACLSHVSLFFFSILSHHATPSYPLPW